MEDTTINENDLVPDSLLAFAKDHRYLQACRDLMQQIVPKQEAWWWSLLLYATLVVRRRNGTTLGMDFMGLQHSSGGSVQRRRLFDILLATGWAVWTRRCIRRLKSNPEEEEEQRHEQLRGAARRYFFQEQRRAMMKRAQSDGQTVPTPAVPPENNSTAAAAHDATNDWVKRMKTLFQRSIQILSEALSSTLDNPHSLPDSTTTTLMSIGRWFMRLHLAHYCMTGTFPTLWNRFLTLSVERRQDSSGRIADPPPTTHKLVGRLILIQAGATLTQALARWWVSYLATRRIQQENVNNTTDSNDNFQATAAMTDSSMHHYCGICRMPRLHSAAPKSCGHVFCWKCLYQWVSTVRPSCPLCRVACRPQDILALHNY